MSKHRQSYRKGAYKVPHGLIPHDGYSGRRENARAILKIGTRIEQEESESSCPDTRQWGDSLSSASEDLDIMRSLLPGWQMNNRRHK